MNIQAVSGETKELMQAQKQADSCCNCKLLKKIGVVFAAAIVGCVLGTASIIAWPLAVVIVPSTLAFGIYRGREAYKHNNKYDKEDFWSKKAPPILAFGVGALFMPVGVALYTINKTYNLFTKNI